MRSLAFIEPAARCLGNVSVVWTVVFAAAFFEASAAEPTRTEIFVHASQRLHPISRYLTGACIEDVNHEIYGGIDSQMIFGESFAEPAVQLPLKGFQTYDGRWTLSGDGSVQGVGSDGAKIIWNGATISEGEVSVDVKLTEATGGNGGLILKVRDAGKGADVFTGYEVSLERPGFLVLGRHRQNWEPIRRVPCAVPVNEWIHLSVRLAATSLEVRVNGKSVTNYEDTDHPLDAGAVGVRIWQHKVHFRNLAINAPGSAQKISFEYDPAHTLADAVSDMWRPIRQGHVEGGFSLISHGAFSGSQSQQINFTSGDGVVGIENQSLNRWGMNFRQRKNYEGYVWARAESPTELFVALESKDGTAVYSEKSLKIDAGNWHRFDFSLTPKAADIAGRFAMKLKQPGAVTIGYAFLQPGSWGRFKNLPVRKDVAEGLINQGVTVLRYGGSMINNPEYRWKKMIGPRALRPPAEGHWYPYSSDGWGIFDFLNFCEAAGFLGIPDLDINESPQDVADLMDYLDGAADSGWGKKRVADGHPKPYRLKYIELGNEERVDDSYFEKFKARAEVIWSKDPSIILIVGDFAYHKIIGDPFSFTGADGGITSLAAQQKILQLAKKHDREVWFDLHVGTDGPRPDSSLPGMFSYVDALDKIAAGAKHKIIVFELNADNHSQRRALANALAINAIQRDGRLPITCSANCLQPDGQNDNGWNQGLLFLNPSQVWLQPPGFVTQMISRNWQPWLLKTEVTDPRENKLDALATVSDEGRTVVLQVVNIGLATTATIRFAENFSNNSVVWGTSLAAALDDQNTVQSPNLVKPVTVGLKRALRNGSLDYLFPAHSFSVIRVGE